MTDNLQADQKIEERMKKRGMKGRRDRLIAIDKHINRLTEEGEGGRNR